jgi:hypothetical protein
MRIEKMKKSAKRSDVKDPEPEPGKIKPASLDDALISEFCRLIARIALRVATENAKNPGANRKSKAWINKKLEKAKLIGFYDAARIPEISKSEVFKCLTEIQKGDPENELLIPVSSLKALLNEGGSNKKSD